MLNFLMSINDLDWERLNEGDYELKFFVWSRKIEEHVEWLEEIKMASKEDIGDYLEKCAWLRHKFLDPRDLTGTEIYYMEKIQPIWREYKRTDPIWEVYKEL